MGWAGRAHHPLNPGENPHVLGATRVRWLGDLAGRVREKLQGVPGFGLSPAAGAVRLPVGALQKSRSGGLETPFFFFFFSLKFLWKSQRIS